MKNSSLVHFKLLGYFNSKREEAMSATDGAIIKVQMFVIAPQPAQAVICFFSPSFNDKNSIISANRWVRVVCQPLSAEETHQEMGISVLYLGGGSGPVSDAHDKGFLVRMLGGGQ